MKFTKKILLTILTSSLLLRPLQAENIQEQNRDLSELIGRCVLVLSKDSVVSIQDFDSPILWINAKLGRVSHPAGKLSSMGNRWETEMVPTDSGIVLRFYGPYPNGAPQSAFLSELDAKKRKFKIRVNVDKANYIGIAGSWGVNFPSKTVEDLRSLSTEPVPMP